MCFAPHLGSAGRREVDWSFGSKPEGHLAGNPEGHGDQGKLGFDKGDREDGSGEPVMVPGRGPSGGRDGESCQGGELSEDQVVDDRRPQDCEDGGDDQTSVGVVQANGRWGVPDKPDRAYDRCLGDQQPDCRCHRERQHSKWGKKECDVPGIDEPEREGATVGGAIPPKRLAHCRPDR